MKKILLVVLVSLLGTFAYSQVGVKGGFDAGFPVNGNNDKAKVGFYFGLTYNFNENMRIEFLQDILFQGQTNTGIAVHNNLYGSTVGFDYSFVLGSFRPYLGLNLGSFTFQSVVNSSFGKTKATSTYFGLVPKIGLDYAINDNLSVGFAVKHNLIVPNNKNGNLYNMVGLNVGVAYKM